jgi:hypothetical protein
VVGRVREARAGRVGVEAKCYMSSMLLLRIRSMTFLLASSDSLCCAILAEYAGVATPT